MERPAYLTTLCLVEDLLISEGGIEIADLNPKSKIRNPKSEILTPLNTCVKITVINEALFLSMRSLISPILRKLRIVSFGITAQVVMRRVKEEAGR